MVSKKDKAIYTYVFHQTKCNALSENISLTLMADRMPEGELEAWLNGKGYHWEEEYENWLHREG